MKLGLKSLETKETQYFLLTILVSQGSNASNKIKQLIIKILLNANAFENREKSLSFTLNVYGFRFKDETGDNMLNKVLQTKDVNKDFDKQIQPVLLEKNDNEQPEKKDFN